MARVTTTWFAALCLMVVAGSAVYAQDGSPSGDELCEKPDPARAARLALDNDDLIIAVAEATAARDLAEGTPVKVSQVVEGKFDATEVIADRNPTLTCLSDGVWEVGKLVVGVFFVASEKELVTMAAWPVEGGKARLNGVSVSFEELLEMGRNFVEPTPTALPPGVPTPPKVEPPDSGGPLPQPTTVDPQNGRGGGAIFFALSGAALAAFFVAVLLRRRRPA